VNIPPDVVFEEIGRLSAALAQPHHAGAAYEQ